MYETVERYGWNGTRKKFASRTAPHCSLRTGVSGKEIVGKQSEDMDFVKALCSLALTAQVPHVSAELDAHLALKSIDLICTRDGARRQCESHISSSWFAGKC